MSLLEQLVLSMDAEIVQNGRELEKFVGSTCPKIQPLLKEITQVR